MGAARVALRAKPQATNGTHIQMGCQSTRLSLVPTYWNNFEVADLSFLRGEQYQVGPGSCGCYFTLTVKWVGGPAWLSTPSCWTEDQPQRGWGRVARKRSRYGGSRPLNG